MADVSYEQEIVSEIHDLKPEQQREVLQYIRALKQPKGTPGKVFLERTRDIYISPEDLRAMEEAIEEWCERIDDAPEVKFDE